METLLMIFIAVLFIMVLLLLYKAGQQEDHIRILRDKVLSAERLASEYEAKMIFWNDVSNNCVNRIKEIQSDIPKRDPITGRFVKRKKQ